MKLYLKYQETVSGGKSTSDKQYSSRTPQYKETSFIGVSRESSGFFRGHDIEVSEEVYNSDKVYLVIYKYQSGDSFGTSHGNWDIWLATNSEEEAVKVKDDIEYDRLDSKKQYLPWKGYFQRLEDVEVHCFNINRSNSIHYY